MSPSWKRAKKHKDTEGRVRRVFQHPDLGDVAVVETGRGLELDHSNPSAPTQANRFTRPSRPAPQVQAAERLMGALRDGQLDTEDVAEHPDYLAAAVGPWLGSKTESRGALTPLGWRRPPPAVGRERVAPARIALPEAPPVQRSPGNRGAFMRSKAANT